MSRVLVALTVVGCLSGADALACGDKFLVIGRAVRSQRAQGAVQKAAILMYLDPGSELPAAMKEASLESDLKLAGHTLRSVTSRAALAAALDTQRFDIVLVGIGDMTSLAPQLGAAPGRPTALPIVYNPTSEELAQAEHQYRCVMRSPGKRQHYLAVIDDAMALRREAERARNRESREGRRP